MNESRMIIDKQTDDAALSELASEVILMYPVGADFRTEDVLAAHPDLATSRRSVIKLSFEEFCRRHDQQESIDISEFVERFPEIESSLRAQINVHSMLLKDEEQLEKLLAPQWPTPDSPFLDWHIRRLIGRGGFARVYLADEPKVGNRPVALKLTTRVGHECDLVGRLNHPNICQILSVRDDDPSGVTAIAMPYHGEATLHDLLETTWHRQHTRASEQLPDWGPATEQPFVDAVVKMAIQLCDALEYAHASDVLHCDLKPSNVLLKSDGVPILLDFNLAFSMQEGSRVLGGTVGYMAPEQIRATIERGEHVDIDVRSDVFGLGGLLYHLLGGEPAFTANIESEDGDRLNARLVAIAETPPVRLHERNRAVPTELSDLIQRCLSADPAQRLQSMGEVRAALARMLPAPSSATIAHDNSRLSPRGWTSVTKIAMGALAATVLTAAVFLMQGWMSPASLDINQEIPRLLAIENPTTAERELLAYYYCCDEKLWNARDILQELVVEEPDNVGVQHNLAYCEMQIGDHAVAKGLFLRAAALDSTSGLVWTNLADCDARLSIREERLPNPEYLESRFAVL